MVVCLPEWTPSKGRIVVIPFFGDFASRQERALTESLSSMGFICCILDVSSNFHHFWADLFSLTWSMWPTKKVKNRMMWGLIPGGTSAWQSVERMSRTWWWTRYSMQGFRVEAPFEVFCSLDKSFIIALMWWTWWVFSIGRDDLQQLQHMQLQLKLCEGSMNT